MTTIVTTPTAESDPLTAAAEHAWLEYAKGTYSETDKQIFIEGFIRGAAWRKHQMEAEMRRRR